VFALLLPVSCRRQLLELSDEMVTKRDVEFYQDGRDALLSMAVEILSSAHTPLPSLATRFFRPGAREKLDSKLLRAPNGVVEEFFWQVVRRLEEMLGKVLFEAAGGANTTQRARVLDEAMGLRHDVSALVDYLDRIANATLPSLGKKKSSKEVLAQMERGIDRCFKIPINLVKHAQHRLAWVEQSTPRTKTAGFIVFGAIEPGVRGSAYEGRPIEEGYSFAFFLRSALPSIFAVCRICESALDKEDLLEPASAESLGHVHQDETVAQLRKVLDLCASLPVIGFPNERGRAVTDLQMVTRHVSVGRQFKLGRLDETCTTTLQVDSVHQGDSVKLPYWMRGT
jgi:hypothetical protein